MWVGMAMSEYEYVPGELPFHKPTGIRLERPERAPHGMPDNPFTLRSGLGANWAAKLKITYVRASQRAHARHQLRRAQGLRALPARVRESQHP